MHVYEKVQIKFMKVSKSSSRACLKQIYEHFKIKLTQLLNQVCEHEARTADATRGDAATAGATTQAHTRRRGTHSRRAESRHRHDRCEHADPREARRHAQPMHGEAMQPWPVRRHRLTSESGRTPVDSPSTSATPPPVKLLKRARRHPAARWGFLFRCQDFL